MSDDLVKRWDDYVESMGCVMGEVEHTAQQMRDRIEELETVLRDVDAWVDDLLPYVQEGHEPATVFKRVKEVLSSD